MSLKTNIKIDMPILRECPNKIHNDRGLGHIKTESSTIVRNLGYYIQLITTDDMPILREYPNIMHSIH